MSEFNVKLTRSAWIPTETSSSELNGIAYYAHMQPGSLRVSRATR